MKRAVVKYATWVDNQLQWCVDTSAHWIMRTWDLSRGHIRYSCGILAVALSIVDVCTNSDQLSGLISLVFAFLVLVRTYISSTQEPYKIGTRSLADFMAYQYPIIYGWMKVSYLVCVITPRFGWASLANLAMFYELYLMRTPDEPPPELAREYVKA
jgi:hypothetical protein